MLIFYAFISIVCTDTLFSCVTSMIIVKLNTVTNTDFIALIVKIYLILSLLFQ